MSIISITDLDFYYGKKHILSNINIEIFRGENVVVIGPNGAGKSTLVKIIAGVLEGYEGVVEIKDGARISYLPQRSVSIGDIFPATSEEVVLSGLVSKKGVFIFFDKKDRQKAKKAMQIAGVEHLEKRNIQDLSGGERQKVFIARSLVSEPDILLFDEPSTGIDAKSRADFYAFLKRLNKEHKITIIHVTHDLSVVSEDVDKVVCINKEICSCSSAEHFLHSDKLKEVYGKKHKFHIH